MAKCTSGLRERRRVFSDTLPNITTTLHAGTPGCYSSSPCKKMDDNLDQQASSATQKLRERRLPDNLELPLPTLHPGTLSDLEFEAEEYVLALIKGSNPLSYLGSLLKSWYKGESPLVSPHGFSTSKPQIPLNSPCLETSPQKSCSQYQMSWTAVLSIIFLKTLLLFAKPIDYFGNLFEYYLNLMYVNHGLRRTLQTWLFNPAALRWPSVNDEDYYCVTGLIDPRQGLHIEEGILSDTSKLDSDAGMKSMADVCVMASKVAYENEKMIKSVVEEEWKMNFVQFYNCWNDYLEYNATQGFIFTDKKKNANIIVVAFRGTQVFNMHDWCSDFDFSYYVLPEVGRVHVGFLEALGLGSRLRKETFKKAKDTTSMKAKKLTPAATPTTGLSEKVISNDAKVLAYDAMSAKVRSLLRQNLGAKLYITGHSLGGALATLFSALLLIEEDEACASLGGVFTFGQPRVGDAKFARYMEKKLCHVSPRKYFRVVYRTDIVPRVPFDDILFQFKHISPCHYYMSRFGSKALQEEPYKNVLSLVLLPMPHINALKELFESLRLRWRGRGQGGYIETGLSIMTRFGAMILPGLCAHFPSNYVDAVRGAPSSFLLQAASFKKRSWGSEIIQCAFDVPKLFSWSRSSSTHKHVH